MEKEYIENMNKILAMELTKENIKKMIQLSWNLITYMEISNQQKFNR